MKIVIDIPERYLYIQSILVSQMVIDKVWDAVKEGIRLPEGHGRLIDADALYREIETEGWFDSDDEYYGGGLEDIVLNAPTIIEADKEEE